MSPDTQYEGMLGNTSTATTLTHKGTTLVDRTPTVETIDSMYPGFVYKLASAG